MDWILTGTVLGALVTVCYLLDWLVSKKEEDRGKLSIIKWWSQLDDFSYGDAIKNSNTFCNDLLNRVYGPKHFTFRCFAVSCCVSLLSVVLLAALYVMLGVISLPDDLDILGVLMAIALFINIWFDYISLIETRYILNIAAKKGVGLLPVLLALDLFITAGFFVVPLVVTLIIQGGWDGTLGAAVNEIFRDLVSPDSTEPHIQVCFLSTFSTSIFFYVFCLSTLVFKLIGFSKKRAMIVLEKLENSDNLFKALGGFLAVLIGFGKCIYEIVQHVRGLI